MSPTCQYIFPCDQISAMNLHPPFLMFVFLDDFVTGYALGCDYFNLAKKEKKKKAVCSAPVS